MYLTDKVRVFSSDSFFKSREEVMSLECHGSTPPHIHILKTRLLSNLDFIIIPLFCVRVTPVPVHTCSFSLIDLNGVVSFFLIQGQRAFQWFKNRVVQFSLNWKKNNVRESLLRFWSTSVLMDPSIWSNIVIFSH